MRVREALRQATAKLEAAGVPDAGYDAALMLSTLLEMGMLEMRIEGQRELNAENAIKFSEMTLRRSMREPLQYILGETEFMGLAFHVEPGVLIPRHDTETLAQLALDWLKDKPGARVLDIGTGSGALAVTIAKLANGAQVTAVDVSDTALSIAKGNAEKNGVSVRFAKSDCFAALPGERFDMIVSNPPYIDEEEMRDLMPEVLREPELALYGGSDGLDFYRRITKEAPEHLNAGGALLFEIGWKQKDAVSALLRETIGEPVALRDLGDNWRVVGARMEE